MSRFSQVSTHNVLFSWRTRVNSDQGSAAAQDGCPRPEANPSGALGHPQTHRAALRGWLPGNPLTLGKFWAKGPQRPLTGPGTSTLSSERAGREGHGGMAGLPGAWAGCEAAPRSGGQRRPEWWAGKGTLPARAGPQPGSLTELGPALLAHRLCKLNCSGAPWPLCFHFPADLP